jgi:hypothetical protein
MVKPHPSERRAPRSQYPDSSRVNWAYYVDLFQESPGIRAIQWALVRPGILSSNGYGGPGRAAFQTDSESLQLD